MEVLIRFIGIVLFACLGDDPNDACTGPVVVNAYLPDGRAVSKPEGCGHSPLPYHDAYILVQQKHTASPGWTAIDCDSSNPSCKLYKLEKDTLTVSGLGSTGVSSIGHARDDLRLRNLYPNLKLLPHPDAVDKSVAWMELKSGDLRFTPVGQGMYVGELSQKVKKDKIEITAKNATGSRTIVIEEADKVTFDILNMPTISATHDHQGTAANSYKHFFLYYLLAANPPKTNCRYPKDQVTVPVPPRSTLLDPAISFFAAYVSCSNSTYP